MMKISVCIPVYNVEKYIERCARSLFEQTMKDGIEFIFVDDCTPDKSMEILEKVLAEYPARKKQVVILHHEKNKGLVGTRNTALKIARGNYIIHCDSDDWVDLNMYEAMYNKAVETGADMVCCSLWLEYENGKRKRCQVKNYTSSDEMFRDSFYTTIFSPLVNKLFRRSIVFSSGIIAPDHICMGEDLLRVSQMLLKSTKIQCASDAYYHYWQRRNSMVHSSSERHHQEIYEILSSKLPDHKKDFLLPLSAVLFLKALFYYGESEETDKFYKDELSKNHTEKLWLVMRDRRIRCSFKIIYLCGCMNSNLANRIIRYLKKRLKLNR